MNKNLFKITKSNMKLGNSKKIGTVNKVAGGGFLAVNVKKVNMPIDELIKKAGGVIGTCSGYCSGCFNSQCPSKSKCYVWAAYNRYPSVRLGHARNTLLMRLQPEQCFIDLDSQLTRARKKYDIIRIHQSGELETQKEFSSYVLLAEKHPETIFYIYTKNYNVIYNVVSQRELPDNLYVLLSVWHQSGLIEYQKMRQYKHIKAFVYCDDYDYAASGIQPEFMCPAYDVHGKMNHQATCDRCQACFNRKYDIIGCYDH